MLAGREEYGATIDPFQILSSLFLYQQHLLLEVVRKFPRKRFHIDFPLPRLTSKGMRHEGRRGQVFLMIVSKVYRVQLRYF